MNAINKSLLTACGILMVASGAHAWGGKDRFATLDTDNNGEITLDEMNAHQEQRFETTDTDGNGELSLEEFKSIKMGRHGNEDDDEASNHHNNRMEIFFRGLDVDNSGGISISEAQAMRGDMNARFTELDADGSGGVSKDEMKAARRHHKKGHDKDDH